MNDNNIYKILDDIIYDVESEIREKKNINLSANTNLKNWFPKEKRKF